jgi:GGDEF domain-containing protein
MPIARSTALIIDPDTAHAHLLAAQLEKAGANVTTAQGLSQAGNALAGQSYDLVCVDTTPRRDVHAVILGLRRQIPTYCYVALMRPEGVSIDEPARTYANDVLDKPMAVNAVPGLVDRATTLLALMRRLNNPDQDFSGSRGIIAKSAFTQLFLSCFDRADRYGEESHIMFIRLTNIDQLRVMDGEQAAKTAAAMVAQQLSRLRRQSDILAQTGPQEYALLLQRPAYATEPTEAAYRFADALANNAALAATANVSLHLELRLMTLPSGHITSTHDLMPTT